MNKINSGTNGIIRLISFTRLMKKGTTSRTPTTLRTAPIGFLKAGLLITDNITPTKRITIGISKTIKPIAGTTITCVDEDEVGTGAVIVSNIFSRSTHTAS